MPGTDTSDLSETSMGLSGESGDTESLDDTSCSLTSGDTNNVDHLVVVEELTDGDILLELGLSELDLVSDGSTVNLDFHEVGLLLSKVELIELGASKASDGGAVLLHSLDVSLDGLLGL